LGKLAETEGVVVYEGDSEYVYGASVRFLGDTEMYLRIGKSLALMETAVARMGLRTALLAVFVFILTFAIASAVAGWVVNPIVEMTKKAQGLARGDFSVDFHGNDYGIEMIELADSLNYARDELSKTDRMQKELIANVSHDFKTPLTMIKGYASMIIEISGNNPEKRNKHAQIIVDEADRLASLVNDVLDLSKISAGITQLESVKINMSAYLEEILGRFDYLKDGKGYSFETDIEKGLYTIADKVKIGQALYNLIGNAVNYTGEDKQVYVSLKREGDFFRFAVTDTGKGIKPEELGDIWDRYYRSSESHKRPVQGTGLGLSIVKTVLERHAFRFGVESELEKGSTFFVLFPLVEND
jgi:signal transduction histidine kinase